MPQPIMERRRIAAQATLDRFRDMPFVWGRADCARMVAFHMRKLGLKPKIAAGGSYSSALGARRALVRAGHESLAAAMDAHGLVRIPPASAVMGDILSIPANDVVGALAIALGNGRVIMWHEDAVGAVVCQPVQFEHAWSVL